MKNFCVSSCINMVPIEEVKLNLPYNSIEKLIERAKGKYPSGNQKEGIVIRPVVTTHSKILNGPLSMKVLNNDYLLKDNWNKLNPIGKTMGYY